MHAFRPTNELARMDFSISPEGDVSWYTGTFSTDEKIAGREDLCGEHYAVPAVHACHLENNTCFAYMDGRRMVVYSCNQVPHTLRRNIAEAIGMPLGDVRVVKPFWAVALATSRMRSMSRWWRWPRRGSEGAASPSR